MPLGWKGLWFVTAFTAIVPGFMGFFFEPPTNGPGTGSMGFFLTWISYKPFDFILKFIITFGLTSFFFWWYQTRSKKLEDGNHLHS
jgi:hypothetical protein